MGSRNAFITSSYTVIFVTAFVYLRPRYLQYRKDEMKRIGQAEFSTDSNSRWFSTTRTSTAEGAPPPAHRNMFQTLGDAFRDGAIDDEAELDELEAKKAERAAKLAMLATEAVPADKTEPTRVSFWSPGENKPMQLSSAVEEDEGSEASLDEISGTESPDDGSAVDDDGQRQEGDANASGADLLSSVVSESKPFDASMHFF